MIAAPDLKIFPTRPAAQRYIDVQLNRDLQPIARPELSGASAPASRSRRSTSKGRWVVAVIGKGFVRADGGIR